MKRSLWALLVVSVLSVSIVGLSSASALIEQTRTQLKKVQGPRALSKLLSAEAGTVLYLNMGFINKLGIEEWGNQCRWDWIVVSVKYKWGPTLNDPNDPWRVAFASSISDWNEVTLYKNYGYDQVQGKITFNKYYRPDLPTLGGLTESHCTVDGLWIFGEIWGNTAVGADTFNQRRTITGHELGHGLGLDHASSNTALMYRRQLLGYYFVAQPRDIELVNAVHAVYP